MAKVAKFCARPSDLVKPAGGRWRTWPDIRRMIPVFGRLTRVTVRGWIRALVMASIVGGALLPRPADAQDGSPSVEEASDGRLGSTQPDPRVLDAIVKDLRLSLLSRAGEATLRMPLAPGQWTLMGALQPYAALSPSLIKPGTDGVTGLALPGRDQDDFAQGLG